MSADDDFLNRLNRLLKARIPGCERLLAAERLSGGASQETWRINIATSSGETLLAMRRAPGGEEAEISPDRPGLEVEARLMRCAREAGIPAPRVHHVLKAGDGLGKGFIMEWLDGEALGARIVRAPEYAGIRPHLAYECGRLLARIHNLDVDRTGLRKQLAQISPAEFVEQTWERYRALDTPQPMIDYTGRWLMQHLPARYEVRLVHNDFRNGNFLLTPDRITAVLDWELSHLGDPMRDLGWVCTNSWRFGSSNPVGGFGQYEDLFRGYEDESGREVDPDHVKFWEVFGSFWWAIGCLGMAEHYRTGPDRTVERPTIGRRSSECQADCVNLLIPGPVTLVPEAPAASSTAMPRTDELLTSVRDFLRDEVMDATHGRTRFLARVAANSLGIVLRELSLGKEHQMQELVRLRDYFGSSDDLVPLRWRLVKGLREGQILLSDPDVQIHLRQTTMNQLAIDQPAYSGLKRALDDLSQTSTEGRPLPDSR